jgi:hypothetical protein
MISSQERMQRISSNKESWAQRIYMWKGVGDEVCGAFRDKQKEKSRCKKDSVEGPRKKRLRIMIGRDYLNTELLETESEWTGQVPKLLQFLQIP